MLVLTELLHDQLIHFDELSSLVVGNELVQIELLHYEVDVDCVEYLDKMEQDQVCAVQRICTVYSEDLLLSSEVLYLLGAVGVESHRAV